MDNTITEFQIGHEFLNCLLLASYSLRTNIFLVGSGGPVMTDLWSIRPFLS